MVRMVLLDSCWIYLQQITLITLSPPHSSLLVRKGASPDLRRGRTGADPGVADEADSEGWTEKSDTWSVSLISLRTLLAR